jgi:hypothetical protein
MLTAGDLNWMLGASDPRSRLAHQVYVFIVCERAAACVYYSILRARAALEFWAVYLGMRRAFFARAAVLHERCAPYDPEEFLLRAPDAMPPF